jgi:hypothetical protein
MDEELRHITKHVFLSILPKLMEVMREKRYAVITKIKLFEHVNLFIGWRKIFHKRILSVTWTPFEYKFVDDDYLFMNCLMDFITHKNIAELTQWYDKNERYLL